MLEFLIKNGSERVIDDARQHLSLLKMLRQFQFHDANGKDQGLNVRNRAKELADLLSDVDKIRAERKKARSNRNKFGGVEGGPGLGGSTSGGSRYGGFGREEANFGGYNGRTYGDGGGFDTSTSGGFQDNNSSRKDRYEEYDEGDDVAASSTSKRKPSVANHQRKSKAEEKPKEPEVDLFEFGDEEVPPMTPPKASNGKEAATADDDDFDDFISADPAPQAVMVPKPTMSTIPAAPIAGPSTVPGTRGSNFSSLAAFSTLAPATSNSQLQSSAPSNAFSAPIQPTLSSQASFQQTISTGYQAAQPNYFTSVPLAPSAATSSSTTPGGRPINTASPVAALGDKATSNSTLAARGGDAFGSLWSSASASAGIKKPAPGSTGPNLASLAKEKATAGIWGAAAQSKPASGQMAASTRGSGGQSVGGGLDDLLG